MERFIRLDMEQCSRELDMCALSHCTGATPPVDDGRERKVIFKRAPKGEVQHSRSTYTRPTVNL